MPKEASASYLSAKCWLPNTIMPANGAIYSFQNKELQHRGTGKNGAAQSFNHNTDTEALLPANS